MRDMAENWGWTPDDINNCTLKQLRGLLNAKSSLKNASEEKFASMDEYYAWQKSRDSDGMIKGK